MVIGRVLAAVAFVLLLSWPTQAAELFTAPLVLRENFDLIQCQIVNVGNQDRSIRMLIVDHRGNALVDALLGSRSRRCGASDRDRHAERGRRSSDARLLQVCPRR